MSVQVLKQIFQKSVESVQPQNLISNQIKVNTGGHLTVGTRTYPLRKPCYVAGFGKAVLGMALELERLLQDNLKMGIATIPAGTSQKFKPSSRRIKFIEGAKDNIPDENALIGAQEIKQMVESLREDDLLILLVSGGGSALLPLPKPPITLQEKQDLIKELSRRGADILELNCVRKQISLLKGGGLAELAFPAKVVTLILSDVVGDPLGFIASGPTVPNSDSADQAVKILKKYGCFDGVSESIKRVLTAKKESKCSGINIKDGRYTHVDNFIIGNNKIAAKAACECASFLGFQSVVLSTFVTGDVGRIAEIYAKMADIICNSKSGDALVDFLKSCELRLEENSLDELMRLDFGSSVCLIASGEPTVVVNGDGRGGRNQQLALELSVRLNKLNIKSADILFLSAGTDGIDGPTDAAGAIGSSDLVNNSLSENIKAEDYLNNNDSYAFYSAFLGGECLIKIGHTGTNVMDIHVMLVKPKQH